MKSLIIFFAFTCCIATDLGTDVERLKKCSQHLKTLIIDCFDHLEYNYFKHFYPTLMQDYEGRNRQLEKYKIGDVFFEPVENYKWVVHNYRGAKDDALTNHLETRLIWVNKIVTGKQEWKVFETQFKEICVKTHKRVMNLSDTKNDLQLSNVEKETMFYFIWECMNPEIYGDVDVVLKFFILTNGSIAGSSEYATFIACKVCTEAILTDKRVLLKHALRCLKKLNFAISKIALQFVHFGDIPALKLFTSVFGEEILHSKICGAPLIHFTVQSDFLFTVLDKLKWLIEEQGIDPAERYLTFFGSIGLLKRFKMSVERTDTNKNIYDEITDYITNEIEAAQSKKSLKRKIKDCVVNRTVFYCESLSRKIFKN